MNQKPGMVEDWRDGLAYFLIVTVGSLFLIGLFWGLGELSGLWDLMVKIL